MSRHPMSREGYDRLKAELDRMEGDEMLKVAAEIGRTRAFGDLRENAEFHAAVEAQGMLAAKIRHLRDRLNRAEIVDAGSMPKDQVAFGSRVKVKDLDFNDEEVFVLVGAGEEDYDQGRILITSPLGQGLVGKRVGETASIETPGGLVRFQVLEIS